MKAMQWKTVYKVCAHFKDSCYRVVSTHDTESEANTARDEFDGPEDFVFVTSDIA